LYPKTGPLASITSDATSLVPWCTVSHVFSGTGGPSGKPKRLLIRSPEIKAVLAIGGTAVLAVVQVEEWF
jgi:hypothetical protein